MLNCDGSFKLTRRRKEDREEMTTIRKVFVLVAVVAALAGFASSSQAQDRRVEITPFVGYTLSEGITVDPNSIINIVVDEISPTSGLSYGGQIGFFVTENIEVGFLYARQESNLELKGLGGKAEVADLKVNNYHGTFTYNFGDDYASVRPYILGGLGATQYSPGDVMGFPIEGNSKFSTTWGGGVKVGSGPVALNIMGRWTPTLIRSDPAGIWCSPFYPWICWQVVDTNYSNQLELSGGVSFRF